MGTFAIPSEVPKDDLSHLIKAQSELTEFDIKIAVQILGSGQVFTPSQNFDILDTELPAEGEEILCPSLEDVRKCAHENSNGEHNWVLSFGSATPLSELYSRYGSRSCIPRFQQGEAWLESKPKPCFYLLDLKPVWNRLDYQAQQKRIIGLGANYVRADENVLVPTLLLYGRRTKKYPLHNAMHWGNLVNSSGYGVCIGYGNDGLKIDDAPLDTNECGNLFVCVGIKPGRGLMPNLDMMPYSRYVEP
jgi:hypothetical protein